MKISRLLTNNAVVVLKENMEEQIVCGKGIGYKKRPGDMIDESLINQVFCLQNPDINMKFQQLLQDISLEEVDVADEIINYAMLNLGKKIDDSIYVSLSDHIHMAVSRYLEGIIIKNVLLWDVKQFYTEEYKIGLYALDVIEERLGVRLPDDEAGFIALHFANATLRDGNHDIHKITMIMQEILNIIKYTYRIDFNTESVYYYRFITHLKFFAQRLISGNIYDDSRETKLYKMMSDKNPKEKICVEKISQFVNKKYNYVLPDEEKLYLTIHLARIMEKNISV